MKNSIQWIALALILFVLFSRIIPHPSNFTPVLAVAIFSGAIFSNRVAAVAVPVSSVLLSNFVLGFETTGFVSVALIGGLAFLGAVRKTSRWSWIGRSFAGSVLFYVLSNFFVWTEGRLYPLTFEGLATCYAMAIPFFKNTLLSTVLYSCLLFEGTRFSVWAANRFLPNPRALAS